MKTPIVVVTGYLGAGKTTLLRRIIDHTDKKIAIIMNEFGQIGIDGHVIRGKNVDIMELSGGCVCCSLTGEFEFAVKEILEKIKPEMIVVETTGVAEPDAIVLDINNNIPGVKLDLVVTIVDTDSIIRFPSIGHTGRIQIEMADVLLLNKIDIVDNEQIGEVRKKIKQINQRARIFETIRCEIDLKILFDTDTFQKEIKSTNRSHLEFEGIDYFFYSTDKMLDGHAFEKFLSQLPKSVYRSKGFVNLDGSPYLFNFVFGRWNFEESEPKKTEIVFIGKNISRQKDSILMKLKECEISLNSI